MEVTISVSSNGKVCIENSDLYYINDKDVGISFKSNHMLSGGEEQQVINAFTEIANQMKIAVGIFGVKQRGV